MPFYFTMTQIIYYVAMSLDGYIATLDGGVDWLTPFESATEDYGYAEFYDSIDAIVQGRHTYEKCLSFGEWPYPDKPCWVVSRKALVSDRAEINITASPPKELVTTFANQGYRRVWLVGGGELAGAFHRTGFIDEYRISVIPVTLGEGIPLLGSSKTATPLTLINSQNYPSGIVQLRYQHQPHKSIQN